MPITPSYTWHETTALVTIDISLRSVSPSAIDIIKRVQLKETSRVATDAIDVSEREPLFLQDKGDQFYQTGDFNSAINAYTKALEKDPSLLFSYANRAACYLHVKEPCASMSDSTKALELLRTHLTPVKENRTRISEEDLKLHCHDFELVTTRKEDDQISLALFQQTGCLDLLTQPNAENTNDIVIKPVEYRTQDVHKICKSCILSRRGSARCFLGDLDGAIVDFTEARKLHSSNEGIDHVLSQIKIRTQEARRKEYESQHLHKICVAPTGTNILCAD
ncbi:hypothetical protein O6H91_01G072500 [Diphasiastrum complanatum]|uniref:Uncharacterized protein n=1 Tax=Diphasiastrum complanatum TaxID=34168 RepID=A0ACC2ES86_DIPCM|nr:hypothetical protein O6H91_01G072500 [Diphasiastrum complanatum]